MHDPTSIRVRVLAARWPLTLDKSYPSWTVASRMCQAASMPISDYASLILVGGSLGGAVLGGWMTYKLQSRIAAQNIAVQRELAQMQRDHTILDRKIDAQVEMNKVVLSIPALPDLARSPQVFDNYLTEMTEWQRGFRKATAPLLTVSRQSSLQVYKEITNRMMTCCNEIQTRVMAMDSSDHMLDMSRIQQEWNRAKKSQVALLVDGLEIQKRMHAELEVDK